MAALEHLFRVWVGANLPDQIFGRRASVVKQDC